MRHFEKRHEPAALVRYRNDGGGYANLPTTIKHRIRPLGCLEQQGLCAFCCSNLPLTASLRRIAHLVPRDRAAGDPGLALTYANMVISCSSGREDGAISSAEASCDEHQGNRRLPITPLEAGCQERFEYNANGQIKPREDSDVDAKATIEILNLRCERLPRARAGVYDDAAKFLEEQGEEEFRRTFLDRNRMPLEPFLPMLECLFVG